MFSARQMQREIRKPKVDPSCNYLHILVWHTTRLRLSYSLSYHDAVRFLPYSIFTEPRRAVRVSTTPHRMESETKSTSRTAPYGIKRSLEHTTRAAPHRAVRYRSAKANRTAVRFRSIRTVKALHISPISVYCTGTTQRKPRRASHMFVYLVRYPGGMRASTAVMYQQSLCHYHRVWRLD